MSWWVAAGLVMLAAATAAATPRPELVELRIEGAAESAIILVEGDELWVPVAPLCAVRLCRDGDLEREGVSYVALAGLGDAVTSRFDPVGGVLELSVAAMAKPVTTISLGVGAPAEIEYGAATSGFLNYAFTGQLRSDGQRSTIGALEAGLSIRGALVYTAVSALDDRVVRGISSITLDDRDRLLRLVAGDALVSSGLLGGGGIVGGVHLGRDLALDPYFAARPTLSQSGAVASPSVVEVYRDGQLVRRDLIPAGPFKIEELAGTTSGDTRVVVRDAFGLTHAVVTSATAPPPAALKPGLVMFDASVGVVRNNTGTASFDYGTPAAIGFVRRGMTRTMTLGVRGEATRDMASGGGGLIAGIGRFALSLDGAASRNQDHHSYASALTVAWQHRRFSTAATTRVVGARYQTLDLAPDADRATRAAELTAGVSIARAVSMGVQAATERMRDRGDRVRASLTIGTQLGSATVLATAAAAREGSRVTAEATLSLSLVHSKRTTSTHSTTARSHSVAGSSTVSRSLGTGTDYGYQATVRDDRSALASVVGQAGIGRVDVTGQWVGDAGGLAIGIAGGLVAIGGRLVATRPVQGAYALVRVPDVDHVRTYVDNQPVGATDRKGDLVVPDLQAFYGNRLRIDVRDLPLDVSTRVLERVVAPPRRGGVIVRVSAPPAAIVRGNVVGLRGGKSVDLSFGELTVERTRFPIGRDGAFEVEGLSPGRHRGAVAIEDGACELELEIPRSRGIAQLASVTCRFL